MFKSDNLKFMFGLMCIMLFVIAKPVYAYIDPGAGSMLIQFLVAIALAISFAIKTFWYRLKGLFTRKK